MSKRCYNRNEPTRTYKPIFVISTEGNTEREYFRMLKNYNKNVTIKVLRDKASDPASVLEKLKSELKILKRPGNKSQSQDQAWVVIDKDSWSDNQVKPLSDWSKTDPQHGFALSNPNFEYWLLLHFEDPPGIGSPRDCLSKLRNHLPGYKKHIDIRMFTINCIETAVNRAKAQPPLTIDWPRTTGTTVYRLVEKLIPLQPT